MSASDSIGLDHVQLRLIQYAMKQDQDSAHLFSLQLMSNKEHLMTLLIRTTAWEISKLLFNYGLGADRVLSSPLAYRQVWVGSSSQAS